MLRNQHGFLAAFDNDIRRKMSVTTITPQMRRGFRAQSRVVRVRQLPLIAPVEKTPAVGGVRRSLPPT